MENQQQLAAHLRSLEEALLQQQTRQDAAQLDALLADDFTEQGVSGTVWTKPAVIAALQVENFSERKISDFRLRLLAEGVALLTYRAQRVATATRPQANSLRCSVWQRDGERWRMLFHQGTPL